MTKLGLPEGGGIQLDFLLKRGWLIMNVVAT